MAILYDLESGTTVFLIRTTSAIYPHPLLCMILLTVMSKGYH